MHRHPDPWLRRAAAPAALAVLALSAIAPAQGNTPEDAGWSRFRGPNGRGVAACPDLPVELGPEKNVVWKTPLPPGHSSPVLWGSLVFVTAFEGEQLLTLALDRATGAIAWRAAVPRSRVTPVDPRNNAASPTAAVDADVVVVFFEDCGLIAYDRGGAELWRVPLGPFDNVYGMGASPVLAGDRVFLACDQSTNSFLLAVSKTDGKTLWKVKRPRATSGHCTPVVYEPAEGPQQLILPGSFTLDSYDVTTGERVWWVNGLSFEMKSVPVLLDGVIYINGYGSPLNQPGQQVKLPPFADVLAEQDGDGNGLLSKDEMPRSRAQSFFEFVDLDKSGALDADEWAYLRAALASVNGMLAIKAGGRGDMTESNVLWTYHRSVPQLPSPLLYEGVLYMLNDQGGLLTTLKPATGEVIERGRLVDAVDNYFASPVAADGKVYFVSESGLVSVLPAGGTLEPLAVNALDEPCYATPAIADGKIYLRTRGTLYCFGR